MLAAAVVSGDAGLQLRRLQVVGWLATDVTADITAGDLLWLCFCVVGGGSHVQPSRQVTNCGWARRERGRR